MIYATKNESKELFRNIQKCKRAKRMPFSVMFEVTYNCNFNCPHCYLGNQKNSEKDEMDMVQVRQVLDELARIGVYSLTITGGEPLCRSDIFDILEYASKKGFSIDLLTNGYFISQEIVDKLKKINLEKIEITINAVSNETFNFLSGIKNGCENVFLGIDFLAHANMPVAIKSTLTSANKDEIEKIRDFALAKKIPYRIDGEILPCKDGNDFCVDKFSLDVDTILKLRKRIYPLMYSQNDCNAPRRTIRSRDKIFNCSVGTTAFSINPYGEMNFCVEIDYPKFDILELGMINAWNKLKKEVDAINSLAKKEGVFICRDCDLWKYCGWCAGRSYIETGEFTQCSEYLKRRAINRKSISNNKGNG